MTWIYAMPAWLFMSAVVVVSSAAAVAALAFFRSRLARNEQITHNDVAGPILATIGTILAVTMSFMVVGVWQEYDSAEQNAQTEASALSDLHHLADAFPKNVRLRVQQGVDVYVKDVVQDEWPLMRYGRESQLAHDAAYRLQAVVASYDPKDQEQIQLQGRALDYVGTALDARRNRILSNRQGIPLILWATMLFCGAITVFFSFYFRVDRPGAQYVMVIALTAVIAICFGLIAELDYPFRGDIAVEPYAFNHVIEAIHDGVANLQT